MEKELSRNKAHEVALFAIYDILTYSKINLEAPVMDIVSGLCETEYADSDYFVKEMVVCMLKHYKDIIPAFESRMRKWTFDRLNLLEQSLLMLAYCQYFYSREKTDKAIVINVSVELAKKYLDANDYKFVNAILDKTLN
ncbi:MAG: transcription antitermination protein NusB [Bacilli bacterium]|nr:transcription antitermination protein NusB [Bacilli bacterium]